MPRSSRPWLSLHLGLAFWQVKHRRWRSLIGSDLLAGGVLVLLACTAYLPLFFFNVSWFLPLALLPRGVTERADITGALLLTANLAFMHRSEGSEAPPPVQARLSSAWLRASSQQTIAIPCLEASLQAAGLGCSVEGVRAELGRGHRQGQQGGEGTQPR